MNIKNIHELSNHEVQDILEDMNMIDDNGNCPYTAEEIFKAVLNMLLMFR